MDNNELFSITPDHLALIRNFSVEWQDCESGAPAINPKRPYGNSDVEADICGILAWEKEDGDEWSELQLSIARRLHRETETALQICLSLKTFEAGVYEKKEKYSRHSWHRIL